jgi:hypothetical protein
MERVKLTYFGEDSKKAVKENYNTEAEDNFSEAVERFDDIFLKFEVFNAGATSKEDPLLLGSALV